MLCAGDYEGPHSPCDCRLKAPPSAAGLFISLSHLCRLYVPVPTAGAPYPRKRVFPKARIASTEIVLLGQNLNSRGSVAYSLSGNLFRLGAPKTTRFIAALATQYRALGNTKYKTCPCIPRGVAGAAPRGGQLHQATTKERRKLRRRRRTKRTIAAHGHLFTCPLERW